MESGVSGYCNGSSCYFRDICLECASILAFIAIIPVTVTQKGKKVHTINNLQESQWKSSSERHIDL